MRYLTVLLLGVLFLSCRNDQESVNSYAFYDINFCDQEQVGVIKNELLPQVMNATFEEKDGKIVRVDEKNDMNISVEFKSRFDVSRIEIHFSKDIIHDSLHLFYRNSGYLFAKNVQIALIHHDSNFIIIQGFSLDKHTSDDLNLMYSKSGFDIIKPYVCARIETMLPQLPENPITRVRVEEGEIVIDTIAPRKIQHKQITFGETKFF